MSRPMELLATCDVAGRPDTLQVMLHLQLSDGILLVTNEADNSASEKYLDKAKYFGQQLGQDTEGLDEFSAGVRVYDVSDPARPREAGFLNMPGFGTHRLWWAGGPLATASSMPLGYDDFILSVLDMEDPSRTTRPTASGTSASGSSSGRPLTL